MWLEPLWEYEGVDHRFKGPFSLWQLWEWYHVGHLYGSLKVCILHNSFRNWKIKNKNNMKILKGLEF